MFMASRKRLTIAGIFLFCAALEIIVCWLYQGSATSGHSQFSAEQADLVIQDPAAEAAPE